MSSTSFDSTDLPTLNPRTQCVLISPLGDPHFIFAYWDYAPKDIDHLQREFNVHKAAAQFILRIYDLNANHHWDIDVGSAVKSSYIHVDQDNTDYYVEIGLSFGQNNFVALVQSNTVRTPPKAASKRDDLIWQDIKFNRESRPYVKEDIEARREARKKALQKARTYALTDEDIDAYYLKLFAASKQGQAAPSIEHVLKGKWPGVSWEKVNALIKSPDLLRRAHPGASEKFLGELGEGENQSAGGLGASEQLYASSQPGAGIGGSEARLKKRKFFFEVWTELIVHGRTEPDAVVWLNDQVVKLNPDGTFSLRYALPDGEIPLGFIAQSSDQLEQRHIYTRVERAKTIGFPKFFEANH